MTAVTRGRVPDLTPPARSRSSGWLLVICAVCLAILLAQRTALLSAVGVCMVQPARVRRAASAWNGGKSHRAFDETLAQPGAG
jgi:hypothetical protein